MSTTTMSADALEFLWDTHTSSTHHVVMIGPTPRHTYPQIIIAQTDADRLGLSERVYYYDDFELVMIPASQFKFVVDYSSRVYSGDGSIYNCTARHTI